MMVFSSVPEMQSEGGREGGSEAGREGKDSILYLCVFTLANSCNQDILVRTLPVIMTLSGLVPSKRECFTTVYI